MNTKIGLDGSLGRIKL